MINKTSNFDKYKALIIGIIIFIFIVFITEAFVTYFIGDYIVYPIDKCNIADFYNFVYAIGVLLSFSISAYFFQKAKLKSLQNSQRNFLEYLLF